MSLQIYNANCFDVLEAWDGPPVDFLFADLPYGTTRNKWDSVLDLARLWPLLRKVCKPNAAMCFTSQQPFTTTLIASNMSEFRYDWVWEKNRSTGFLNAKKAPLRNHESVLVFYRAQPTYNPIKTTGHRPTHSTRTSPIVCTNYGVRRIGLSIGKTDRFPVSVQRFDAPAINRHKPHPLHPTQKPVPLLEYLIRTYSNPGDLVLDPTAGALTTAVAAHNTGRRAVCVELEREYVDLGIRRLQDAGATFDAHR